MLINYAEGGDYWMDIVISSCMLKMYSVGADNTERKFLCWTNYAEVRVALCVAYSSSFSLINPILLLGT